MLLLQYVVYVYSSPVLSDPHPLQVLIPKLKELSGHTSVLTSVVVAVGELVQVSGPEMAMYADDLFPSSVTCCRCVQCARPSA